MARARRAGKTGPKYRVFVSHATTDKYLARIVCEKLEALGVATFRDDRDIDGGEDIPDRIKSEIARCDELLVLLTPDSVQRDWVLLEVGAAWGCEKRIVAILCHTKVVRIPAMIRSRKAFHLNDFDRYLDEVRGRAVASGGAR